MAAGVIVSVFLSLVSFKKKEIQSGAANTEGTASAELSNEAGLVFDGTTGDFSFTGEDGVDYYTIWVYSVDDAGNESDSNGRWKVCRGF